jgi:U32 family peptidase
MHSIDKNIELLAPGGDLDSIKAAIIAGADAVYCGLDRFNARNRAKNIVVEELPGIVRLAHKNDCKIFITLNIIIVESEIPTLITLLNKLVNTKIDGVIVQDFGLFYLLTKQYKSIPIHASTQLTTHNEGQIQFLSKLAATRVNLSRELSLPEIKELSVVSHKNNLLTEVFVHGSNCLSFSGICYLSSVHGGRSGNRGRCSQPCRNQYEKTIAGNDFPLNLKDNSAYADLGELVTAGVDSIKIEGRIKKFHYVYTVVNAFREQLHRLYQKEALKTKNGDLHRVFNRNFTNSFLQGDISKNMFIDNPRDNSALYRSSSQGASTAESLEIAKRELYDEKTEIIHSVQKRIAELNINKAPLRIAASGKTGRPLTLTVQTPSRVFTVRSDADLVAAHTSSLTHQGNAEYLSSEVLLVRLKALNDTEYYIKELVSKDLQENLFLSFKEITSLKKKILCIVNGGKEFVDPIGVPRPHTQKQECSAPSLSLLISAKDDVYLCDEIAADVYFQLPDSFADASAEYGTLFRENRKLIPWFPSIIIGKDYHAAVDFLQQLQPAQIVTNNSGIAYTAYKQGIPWIAGSYLNSVNSLSVRCLKERFNCSGAFISNELNKNQIKRINKPDDFDLYYSIYHPIPLLTSRQCLFHQVTGCEKNRIDATCIQQCEKSSSITNFKKDTFFLTKVKGGYHCLYNETHLLNTDIVKDLAGFFSGYFIDLRDVETNTTNKMDKVETATLFEVLLGGTADAAEKIKQSIQPTTNMQYVKGI